MVDVFGGFDFPEDIFGSLVKMVFQGNLLRNQEVKESVVSDAQIVAVHRFVLDLLFCGAHQISDSSFGVLSPIGFDVGDLHVEEFLVESVQEGHQEVLLSFNPEVVVGEVECPGVGPGLPKHEEIFSTRNEAQGNESSQEDKGLSPRHAEMFVVGADLFGSPEFGIGADGVGDTEEDWFVLLVERMDVSSLRRSLDRIGSESTLSDFFLESFDIGSISISEDSEGALGDLG